MNQLVKELIKELSPDQSTSRPKNVGVYAGSFKPPTNGHYKVVAQALADNPELDELRVLIGTGKRDGIDQSQALLIWDIYKRYLPFKVVLVPVSEAPIKAVYDYAKENPEIKVDWILGAREGNEEDFTDIAKRTKASDNYPNITLRPTITDSGASGTAARNAYKVSQDKLEKLLPKKLSQEEKDKVYNILNRTIEENYGYINEGKYDSLVTKLAGFTLNAWKGDYKDKQRKGYFEVEVGPGKDFDYPHLDFTYKAQAVFDNNIKYKDSGVAKPFVPEVVIKFVIPKTDLPKIWEEVAMDLRNIIRHEITHLMQAGPNVKKGKEMDDDSDSREELESGKKPWWKIWRRKLGTPDYYKLEKEIDANLEGLYLQAKKSRQPLEKVIDDYLEFKLKLPPKEIEDIKLLWRERAPKLNIPLKESKIGSNWKSRVTVAGPVPPAFLEGDVLTYKGYKNRRGNVTGKFYPQRDYPVEVIGVWWKEAGEHTYKSEYIYKLRLLRSLNKNNRRGMTFPLQTEKEIKDKLADKQLTRAEFERQPTKRKDSFDKPMTFQGSSLSVDMAALEEDDKDYFGLNKLLKEVLDPKNFNFKPLIKSLTNSMEDDGLILKPYPKVQFIHNAKANSEDFFGKTAYYDPGNNIIVLYTLGRHPKDILRSYAHELVHVHQNHEDRLENITTDNVNEDDYLEKIEREAYEEGNIAFRSWTNKMTEKKTKDPFGLNAFAYELARLNEDEEDNWYIYVDMDGVIADFDKRFKDLSGLMPQAYVDKHGLNKFWDLIDEKHKVAFWRGIEIMPGAGKLLNYVSNYPYEILTAPSIKKQSIIGKGLWIKDKIGTLYSAKPKVTYRPAKLKHTVKPNLTKYDVLIDDKKSTIERWNNAGGTAIFYVNADQVINDLKNLGL